MRSKMRPNIGLPYLCVTVIIAALPMLDSLGLLHNPNHTPKEIFYAPPAYPARHFCVDRDGWLWWEQALTICVASDVKAGELTPMDTWSGLHSGDPVCLLVPRTDQSDGYALTRRGRLLSLSVSDSRLSVTEIADFGTDKLKGACVADDSSRTIVASDWDDVFLIDVPNRTISPLTLPGPEGKYPIALAHAGGTRFVAAYLDGTICLFDSQDLASAVEIAEAPLFVQEFTVSPNRTRIALDIGGEFGTPGAVSVRTSETLAQTEFWQLLEDKFHVSDLTWLDDRTLAVSVLERTDLRTDNGEIVIFQPRSTRRRRVKLDFEPWSLLAIAPNRLAISDRDGGVRVIQVDP